MIGPALLIGSTLGAAYRHFVQLDHQHHLAVDACDTRLLADARRAADRRNQHRVGFGSIAEYPGPFPGYTVAKQGGGLAPPSLHFFERVRPSPQLHEALRKSDSLSIIRSDNVFPATVRILDAVNQARNTAQA